MDFPCHVYKIGGPYTKPGGLSYRVAQATEEAIDSLIADGWLVSLDDEPKEPKRRGRPPKS